MILPDRPFQAQIIDQLNFGARYLDPHAGMPRNWLSAHNVIIRNVQEYESSANQLENEARALGLLSIDFERRNEMPVDIERHYLREHARFDALPLTIEDEQHHLTYMLIGTYRRHLHHQVGLVLPARRLHARSCCQLDCASSCAPGQEETSSS
jgi:hypothetical protein